MSNRVQTSLILLCVVAALGFVGYQIFHASSLRTYSLGEAFTQREHLADFAESGVSVALFLDADSQGRPLLRATFTPDDPGFHLYGKDLDPKLVKGTGMPTKLELLPNNLVRVAGRVFADVSVQDHTDTLLGTIPVYPEGPVSLRLPIQFVGNITNASVQAAISYMACKDNGVCLRPVERQVLDLNLPGG